MAEKGNNQKHIVEGVPWAEMVWAGLFTLCMFWAFRATKRYIHEERVYKQVEVYEKTIPRYLEQKQTVAHYRDSLINVKGR